MYFRGAIHSTKISGNFGPKLNGSVSSNRKSFEKTGPPFEVDQFSRSDQLEFWLNGSRPKFVRSVSKQPTFWNPTTTTTGFPTKWRLRNDGRNSILMTCHFLDLGSDSDWLKEFSHSAWPIRSTAQIWVVTHHQFGTSALVSQRSFRGKTSGSVAEFRGFPLAGFNYVYPPINLLFG